MLQDPATGVPTAPLCFASRGFSLHAATSIAADDRPGLEKLLRYVARPPLAAGRLRMLDAGTLSFALKTPWDDGTSHLILTPHELLEKLAALVPPPRVNLIRYHGVIAPSARDRDKIVPPQETPEPPGEDRGPCRHHMPQRLAWATLLARVFSIDVTTCDRCGGRMRVIAALTEPACRVKQWRLGRRPGLAVAPRFL